MSLLTWDTSGTGSIESGLDRGVLYLKDGLGTPWNGLIAVDEQLTDGRSRFLYQDGDRVGRRLGRSSFQAQVAAFTYPDEFEDYRGSFGLSYRTRSGKGHKIHLLYNAKQQRGSRTNRAQLEQASPFSWTISATPIKIPRMKTSAHLVIDTEDANLSSIMSLEDILYGSDYTLPRLPTVAELYLIFNLGPVFVVTDLGDGRFSVEGPDEMVDMIARGVFRLDSPSVEHLGGGYYTVSSM